MGKNFWQHNLMYLFPKYIQERGRAYARDGLVRILAATEYEIIAGVKSSTFSDEYNISIREADNNKLNLYCSCPHFASGYYCKHLWASAIEADRCLKQRGGLDLLDVLDAELRAKEGKDLLRKHGGFVLTYELCLSSRPRLTAVERYVKKDGSFGRAKTVNGNYVERNLVSKEDRIILAIMREVLIRKRYMDSRIPFSDIPLSLSHLGAILSFLAQTGRCDIINEDDIRIISPLKKAAQDDLKFELRARQDKKEKDQFILEPYMRLSTDPKPLSLDAVQYIFYTDPVHIIMEEKLFQLKGTGPRFLEAYALSQAMRVDSRRLMKFVAKSMNLPGAPEVFVPERLAPREVKGISPRPVLVLEAGNDLLQGTVFMDYQGVELDHADSRPFAFDQERWISFLRSFSEEKEYLKALKEKGFEEADGCFQREVRGALTIINDLISRGWSVYGRDKKRIRPGRFDNVRVVSHVDWFDLEGELSFDKVTVPLPRAIQSYLKGEYFIDLGDGTKGLLPEKWLSGQCKTLGFIFSGSRKGHLKRLRFTRSQALLLDALLNDIDADQDEKFVSIKEAIKNFSGLEPQEPSRLFQGELRPYQRESLSWFSFLKKCFFGGILADDMGLGKTVQVLALLAGELEEKVNMPNLLVVPTSLMFNWEAEARRFAPFLTILCYKGGKRTEMLNHMEKHDLIITTYGILRRDVDILREIEFHYAILDESQAIKNASSQTFKAARLIKARHRLCLTGTPLENHAGELWSQMEFLNKGLLGPRMNFDRKFTRPMAKGDEDAHDTLKKLIKPFILRRTKDEVAMDLPDKMESIVMCSMTSRQAMVYDQVRDHYRSSIFAAIDRHGIKKSGIKVLEGLLRLRQVANHPELVGKKGTGSGKLDEIMSLLENIQAGENHKALIFSQFTSMLAIIEKIVQMKGLSYEYLDGSLSDVKRKDRVQRFQDDSSIKIFLISLKAGGFGLNLTAADYVFLVDPWWNPAVELQAVDRAHRIGQEKKVFTYRLISRNSIEEKVLTLQKKKQKMMQSVLSGSKNILMDLNREDLEVLFS